MNNDRESGIEHADSQRQEEERQEFLAQMSKDALQYLGKKISTAEIEKMSGLDFNTLIEELRLAIPKEIQDNRRTPEEEADIAALQKRVLEIVREAKEAHDEQETEEGRGLSE